jgi:DNA polymerase III delta prime subunit
MIHNSLSPGSYIFPHKDDVLEISSAALEIPQDRLHTHPDFFMVQEDLSISIDIIREIGRTLRMRPAIGKHKIVLIENFHLATKEAQNAFLKTFEEPPEYAYIFLVTPYIDRLLKTVVSRAQVIESSKRKTQNASAAADKIQDVLKMNSGERLLWLEGKLKGLERAEVKAKLLEVSSDFLEDGIELIKMRKISIRSIEYLKDVRRKIEQGFPNPKLLMEGFLVQL